MPSNKYLELQDFDMDGLLSELAATETQYQKMKFDNVITGMENPLELRTVRRDIARLKTEIRRRELAEMSAEDLAKRSRIRFRRRKARRK